MTCSGTKVKVSGMGYNVGMKGSHVISPGLSDPVK